MSSSSSPWRASASPAPARMPAWPSPICSDWDERKGAPEQRPGHRPARHRRTSSRMRDAQVFALVPPAVQELGNSTGFDLELEDRGNLGHDGLIAGPQPAAGHGGAGSAPGRRAPQRPGRHAAAACRHRPGQGQRAWACRWPTSTPPSAPPGARAIINDFIDRGRVKRVYMQGDAPFRMTPGGPGPLVCAQRHRHHGALLVLRHAALDHRPGVADALQRLAGHRDPGQPARRASAPARP